jgi:hypothetical protein
MQDFNLGEKLSKAGTFIKDNKKPLLYVGGAVAIIVIGYAVVSRTKKGILNVFTDKTKNETPFIDVEVDDTKVTISDSVANSYANQLYNAMKNAGTDEDLIYSVFQKIEKKDDFRKVYNAFGKKSYYNFGSPTISAWLFGYDDLDLIEWLNKELGNSNFKTYNLVKKVVNNAGFAM